MPISPENKHRYPEIMKYFELRANVVIPIVEVVAITDTKEAEHHLDVIVAEYEPLRVDKKEIRQISKNDYESNVYADHTEDD